MPISSEFHNVNGELEIYVARGLRDFEQLLQYLPPGGRDDKKAIQVRAASLPDAAYFSGTGTMPVFIFDKGSHPPKRIEDIDYDKRNHALTIEYGTKSQHTGDLLGLVRVPYSERKLSVTGRRTDVPGADPREPFDDFLSGSQRFGASPVRPASHSSHGSPFDMPSRGSSRAFPFKEMLQDLEKRRRDGGMGSHGYADAFMALMALEHMFGSRQSMRYGEDGSKNCWNRTSVEEIVSLSRYLKDSNHSTRFAAVGNSASYVVFTIGEVSKKEGTPVPTAYVPFSNRFLEESDTRSSSALTYQVNRYSDQYRGMRIYQQEYRNFLQQLDMHPKEIIKKHDDSKEKTALVDNIQSGTSFASFIYFMHAWAQDLKVTKPFGKSLKCIGLSDEPIPGAISIPSANLRMPLDCISISQKLRLALNSNIS